MEAKLKNFTNKALLTEPKVTTFSNHGALQTQLCSETIKTFWKLIDEAKNNPINMNNVLAGQISSSLRLNKNSPELTDFCQKIIPKMVNTYMENFKGLPIKYNNNKTNYPTLALDELWVNFQKEGEFNPIHDHNGAFSFVIWMKIPTSSIEQNETLIASNSNTKGLVSNFCFTYIDILGNLGNHVYNMEKNIEGIMVMFPSRLNHQVFPFYNNKDTRVSISGNLGVHSKN